MAQRNFKFFTSGFIVVIVILGIAVNSFADEEHRYAVNKTEGRKPAFVNKDGVALTCPATIEPKFGEPNKNRREIAIGTYTSNEPIFGTTGIAGVWQPPVAASDGTASGFYVTASDDLGVEYVQAGWQVYPAKYGDDSTRFYTYWTADDSLRTGCYNDDCPGFVVVNRTLINGRPLTDISEYGGRVVEMALQIKLGRVSGINGLYLSVDDNLVGYWRANIFKRLGFSITSVHYGGQVLYKSGRLLSPLTKTAMGSGHFPIALSRGDPVPTESRVATVRDIQLYGIEGERLNSINYCTFATKPECYSSTAGITEAREDEPGNIFVQYGGPGGTDSDCLNE